MLFRRRIPADLKERLRTWFWPRRSFARSAKYFSKRVLRLRATPHAVATGVAVGVFVTFLPIPGFHILLAALVTWAIAGNVVASALGTALGNPLTFPAIWGATYELGYMILYGAQAGAGERPHLARLLQDLDLSQLWRPLLFPMAIGALPLGLLFAAAFYGLTYWAVRGYRQRRHERFLERAGHRATLASVEPAAAGRP